MYVIVTDALLLTHIVASVATPVKCIARRLSFLKESLPKSCGTVVVAAEVPALNHKGCIFRETIVERGACKFSKQIFFGQHLPKENIIAVLIVPIVVVIRETPSVRFPRIVLAKLLIILGIYNQCKMLCFVNPANLQRRSTIVNPAVATEPMLVHVVAREVCVQLIDIAHLLVGEAFAVFTHSGHHAPVMPGFQEHACSIVSDKVITLGNLVLCI